MAATDVVRLVQVGTGGFGRIHARLWNETPGAKLVGIYDVVPEAARRVAQEFEVPRVFTSLEEALSQDDVDAIDCCTPVRFHTPVVVAALEAGKHCLCEKPLSADPGEVEKMIAARDRSGKLLMTAHHMRFDSRAQALKRLIDAGHLGEIYYARAWWLRRRLAPTTPGLLTKSQGIYGPGLDLGVHVLDLSLFFMSHPQAVSVSGFSTQRLARLPDVSNQWGPYQAAHYEVEDFAAALIKFEKDTALSLEVSWLLNMGEKELTSVWLHGTAGGARWPEVELNRAEKGLLLNTHALDVKGDDGHRNEFIAFCDAVRKGGPSPVPAEHSLQVARILNALYDSAKTGREVRFD